MTAVSVYLIGKNDLLREGIRSLLLKSDFHVVGEYNDVADAPKGKLPGIVIGIDSEGCDLLENVRAIKDACAESRVVVVSARTEIPAVAPVFSAGVDGYILKDISCDGLLGSLRLVASGEKVYPTFMLTALSRHAPMPAANDTDKGGAFKGRPLSRQELKIVHCLANGDPNKIIAHHLSITEATVKVHVKTILRKLGARNRTQAALWAVSQGMFEESKRALMQG